MSQLHQRMTDPTNGGSMGRIEQLAETTFEFQNLWHIILNGDFPPVAKNEVTQVLEVVPIEEQSDNLKKKLAKNNEAKMVLYNALPKKKYERIFMCKTAKDIWQSLLITHQEESINSGFARFNTIITSLKALDEGFSSKNYVRKFLRALHPKWRAKATTIEESKDLGKKEGVKFIALKAKKESSDDETLKFGSDDKEYAMAVSDRVLYQFSVPTAYCSILLLSLRSIGIDIPVRLGLTLVKRIQFHLRHYGCPGFVTCMGIHFVGYTQIGIRALGYRELVTQEVDLPKRPLQEGKKGALITVLPYGSRLWEMNQWETLLEDPIDELITQFIQVCEDVEIYARDAQEEASEMRLEALDNVVQQICPEALAAAAMTHATSTQEETNLRSNTSQNKACTYNEFHAVMQGNFRSTEGAVGLN
ncbi:hypothetical protein Tco_1125341 [Tanacetum coccineum]|uniref:DUF4219 domain-containing protein/UBN2 domain-containing protein n=1 Tax=Tanacetum coccineum TaxID=301880 RepID=A0ABQ5J9E4_9ASTR